MMKESRGLLSRALGLGLGFGVGLGAAPFFSLRLSASALCLLGFRPVRPSLSSLFPPVVLGLCSGIQISHFEILVNTCLMPPVAQASLTKLFVLKAFHRNLFELAPLCFLTLVVALRSN